MKRSCYVAIALLTTIASYAQEGLPTDYLSKEFHAGRREALRKIMPSNSVACYFRLPARTFSNDVTYPYHPKSRSLFIFPGTKSPIAVLLILRSLKPRLAAAAIKNCSLSRKGILRRNSGRDVAWASKK